MFDIASSSRKHMFNEYKAGRVFKLLQFLEMFSFGNMALYQLKIRGQSFMMGKVKISIFGSPYLQWVLFFFSADETRCGKIYENNSVWAIIL